MQSFFGLAAALSSFASTAAALKLYNDHQEHLPCARLSNLAGEHFEVNQPGDQPLLRVPGNGTEARPLLALRGSFREGAHAPCCLHMETLAIDGEWLGNLTVHVASRNGSFSIKVSSSSPAFAGSVRSIESFVARKRGLEAFPRTFKVEKSLRRGRPSFKFYLGPRKLRRPAITVAQGLWEGLDVSLTKLSGLQSRPALAGLLGTERHDKLVEAHTSSCEAHMGRMSKHPGASLLRTSHSVQATELRSLLNESFKVNQPGDYELLRVPKQKKQPALLQVRGTFRAGDNESCVVFLSTVSLGGRWFDEKTVHVYSLSDGSFFLKVSAGGKRPAAFAGRRVGVENFTAATEGREALPDSVKVVAVAKGPSFKFLVGPKQGEKQPMVVVTQALHGGLEVALPGMEGAGRADELAGLLGTDLHDPALDNRTAECEAGLKRLSDVPAGSSLSASW